MALPKFQGKSLIAVPEFVPSIGFLEGDFGKEVAKEVDSKYKGFNAVEKIGKYDSGVVKGSNPLYVVAVNEVIRPEGLRTATQADLEKALKIGVLSLRGQYEDTALVLRTEGDPNSYLAKHLMKQVKARGSNNMPVMIPLVGLDLERDSSSPCGLAFKLRDDAEIFYDPILNKSGGNFSSLDIDEKTGLPKKLSEGDRYFYTRDDKAGLSRLNLSRDLFMYSSWSDLQGSGSYGRVVVMSAKGASQNFSSYVSKLEAEKKRQETEIEEKFSKAMKFLKG